MNAEKRGRGRPSLDATVRITVSVTPELHEWGMAAPGGLAAQVRRSLEESRRRQESQADTVMGQLSESEVGFVTRYHALPVQHKQTLERLAEQFARAEEDRQKLDQMIAQLPAEERAEAERRRDFEQERLKVSARKRGV